MLQRLVTAAVLISRAVAHLHMSLPAGSVAPQIVDVGAAMLLLFGLWTPVVGVIVAGRELWMLFSGGADPWISLVVATLGASLAMIGPGAWSVDARLFGRRQIKTLR